MSHLIQGIVPAALLIFALSAGIQVAAGADKNLPARQGKFAAGNDKSSSSSPDKLCHNHYNELHLKVGKYEEIKAIIDRDKKASVQELTTILSAKNITLDEASWGLYYLGQKSLGNEDFIHFVKYVTAAAADYLNPWAMTLLAKVYYYDKASWQKQFPKANITTDKDLERSYIYLYFAFALSGQIEKLHHDNTILTGVANGGLALKDTFEGTGVSGFDPRKALQKHQKELLAKADAYTKMYEKGK